MTITFYFKLRVYSSKAIFKNIEGVIKISLISFNNIGNYINNIENYNTIDKVATSTFVSKIFSA